MQHIRPNLEVRADRFVIRNANLNRPAAGQVIEAEPQQLRRLRAIPCQRGFGTHLRHKH
jgi:hypothetical protein